MKKYLVLLTLGVSVISVRPALADDVDPGTRAAARALATDGVAAFQKGDIDVASNKLEKAYSLLQVPSIGLWSARALAKNGKLIAAAERYLETTRLSGFKGEEQVQKGAQADAAKELSLLSPRIPSLTIRVVGADTSNVTVNLDGVALQTALLGEKRPVDPGQHRVEAKLGTRHAEQSVSVSEGQQSTVALELGDADAPKSNPAPPFPSPTPSPPSPGTGASPVAPVQTLAVGSSAPNSTHRTLGYVALGAGGVGLLVGGISGVLAIGKRSDIDRSADCSGGHCLPSMQGTVDSLNSLRTISTVGFVAGGVFAAAGLGLVLIGGPSHGGGEAAKAPLPLAARWALQVAPGSVAMRGNF